MTNQVQGKQPIWDKNRDLINSSLIVIFDWSGIFFNETVGSLVSFNGQNNISNRSQFSSASVTV